MFCFGSDDEVQAPGSIALLKMAACLAYEPGGSFQFTPRQWRLEKMDPPGAVDMARAAFGFEPEGAAAKLIRTHRGLDSWLGVAKGILLGLVDLLFLSTFLAACASGLSGAASWAAKAARAAPGAALWALCKAAGSTPEEMESQARADKERRELEAQSAAPPKEEGSRARRL